MISLLLVAVNSALLGRALFYSYKLFLDGIIFSTGRVILQQPWSRTPTYSTGIHSGSTESLESFGMYMALWATLVPTAELSEDSEWTSSGI